MTLEIKLSLDGDLAIGGWCLVEEEDGHGGSIGVVSLLAAARQILTDTGGAAVRVGAESDVGSVTRAASLQSAVGRRGPAL